MYEICQCIWIVNVQSRKVRIDNLNIDIDGMRKIVWDKSGTGNKHK